LTSIHAIGQALAIGPIFAAGLVTGLVVWFLYLRLVYLQRVRDAAAHATASQGVPRGNEVDERALATLSVMN
jgi:hypothetical protein